MKLYFATGNQGKVEHTQNILSGTDAEVEQLNIRTREPQSESIEEIAGAKVEQAVKKTDIEENAFLIADDSGLFVEELDGFPGAQTAFFDRKVGKERLLDLADSGAEAEFRAAIGLHLPEKDEIKVFKGEVSGEIVEPRGTGGLSYDPLFLPEGNHKTWAEDPEYKDRNSHRQEALRKLKEFIQGL